MIDDFIITSVNKEVTKDLTDILERLKKDNKEFANNNCTVNGFQTNSLHEEEYMKPYLDYIVSLLPNRLKHRWFHMIDYDKTGYQREHDHAKTEIYSYIIYLDDSNSGHTYFNLNNNKLFIKPIKDMIVFFPSYIMHGGLEVTDNKKIAVGALV